MLNLIQTELIKLKRKLFVLFALLSSTLPPFINILYTLNLPKNSAIHTSFKEFYASSFTFTQWILLPSALGVIGTVLFFDETENGTLKALMLVPVHKLGYLLSKLAILFLFSILFMVSTTLFSVVGALIFSYTDMNGLVVLRYFLVGIETGVLTAFSIMPIVFVALIAKKSYILPTCATLIYVISGFILSSHVAGIHPLASVAGILETNPSPRYVFNLMLVSILSMGASVYALKTQNY